MTGTVMERSHAELTIWGVAFTMSCASKKGFSAHQLHRQLGCEYNTAWFMFHRVREAMRRGGLEPPMGGEGEVVEADETYFGNIPEANRPKLTTSGQPFSKSKHYSISRKRTVVSLVQRGGEVRSLSVPVATAETVARTGSLRKHRQGNAPAHGRKQSFTGLLAAILRRTKRSITARKNMRATT